MKDFLLFLFYEIYELRKIFHKPKFKPGDMVNILNMFGEEDLYNKSFKNCIVIKRFKKLFINYYVVEAPYGLIKSVHEKRMTHTIPSLRNKLIDEILGDV